MIEEKKKPEPTFVGSNDNLVLIVPKELFTMKLNSEQKLDPKTAKEFSNYLSGTFKGFQAANKTKYNNGNNEKKETTPEFWADFEKRAIDEGVDLIGYIPVQESYIFKDLPIIGKNAIVLGMEMKWNMIKDAPGINCGIESFRVYYELGKITIKLAEYLQDKGYRTEAHHPFGGKLLFTAHAVAANLGYMGRIGLIVTPEFGPRQRWSIITTDADIPKTKKRDFSEMEDFCESCGACIENCIGGATYDQPIHKGEDAEIITHIDRNKCIESMLTNNYCSNCLKVCPQGKKRS